MITKEDEIIKLYNNGNSSRMISKITNISATQIRRILNKNKVEIRISSTEQSIQDKIIEMYNDNLSSEKIAKDLHINPSTVCRVLKRNNIEIKSAKYFNRKYKINQSIFDKIETELSSYFLGLMYADGNVSSSKSSCSITLQNQDISILEKFSNFVYGYRKIDIKEKYSTFRIHSKIIRDDLIKHGCVPNKTFKINELPKIEHLNHFLRGFFDGDGCIYISPENRVSIIFTGYTKFLECIQEYLKQQNIDSNLSLVKPNVSELRILKHYDCYKMLDLLYGNCTIYLDRKYEKYKTAINLLENKIQPSFNYGSSNIISYHGIKLTKDNILKMSTDEKEKAASFVFEHLRQNGFPYPKYSDYDMLNDFEKLKTHICTCNNSVITNISDTGLKIFKHFSPHYFEMKNTSLISMIDAFHNDELLMSVIRNRMGITYKETFNITGNMIRQGFRNSHKSFAGSIFKPALAKFIYDEFTPENGTVLDISIGFGQRLLGAMASSKVKKYIGLDPWSKQIESSRMISKFLNFDNVEFHCTGSESFVTKDIDFCFSSPPFFNKEIYSNESSQAYSNGMDQFIEWWKLTYINVHSSLKEGAMFVLNMDNEIGLKLLELAKDHFKLVNTLHVNYQRKHLGKDGVDKFFVLKKL